MNSLTHLENTVCNIEQHSSVVLNSEKQTAGSDSMIVSDQAALTTTATTLTVSNCMSLLPSPASTTAVYQASTSVAVVTQDTDDTHVSQAHKQLTAIQFPQPKTKLYSAPAQKHPHNAAHKYTVTNNGQRIQQVSGRVIANNQKVQLNLTYGKVVNNSPQKHVELTRMQTKVQNENMLLAQHMNNNKPLVKVHTSHINRASPKSPKNSQNSVQKTGGIKTIPPQRVGLKTLPPQRPTHKNLSLVPAKTNYIGKHAVQAQKQHRTLQNSNKGRGPSQMPRQINNMTTSSNKYIQQSQPQITANQALTAQILQSLSQPMSRPAPSQRLIDTYFGREDPNPEPQPPPPQSNLSLICHAVMLDHNYGAPPRSPTPTSITRVGSAVVNGLGPVSPQTGVYHQQPPAYHQQTPTYQSYVPTANAQSATSVDDDGGSTISTEPDREVEPEGEETETAPEGEGEEDTEGVTRCICDYSHDDGYMICCDRCFVWQHVDCVGIDRLNIPEVYYCEMCEPREMDKQRARALQQRKREEAHNDSDTSTASSTGDVLATMPIGNAILNKKRMPVPPPLPPRRKADSFHRRTAPPGSAKRRSETKKNSHNKKKQEKRNVVKRKVKLQPSVDNDEDSQEAWPYSGNVSSSLLQLRQWIDKYEEAVTNHYSPELRARMSNMRLNGSHTLSQADSSVHKCKLLTQPLTGIKILVASTSLSANTPIVELRGKYMLSQQHRAVLAQPGGLLTRQHAQRPGPFLFFYRLPRDSTEVCVDTRTYGNDARFVRRSCKPNAELRHCVEKGALHLYIVTLSAIEKNAELTIRHETHDLAAAGTISVACACGNLSTCGLNQKRNNGAHEVVETNTQKKRKGRRISEPSQPSPVPPPERPVTPVEAVPPTSVTTRRASQHLKVEVKTQDRPTEAPQQQTPPNESKDKKKKLTREERKMEAIVKAIERMEKAEQRKQEVQARQAQRRESEPAPNRSHRLHDNADEPKARRKKRKGRARTVSTSQISRRQSRVNSTDSYATSGEDGSLLSPPLPASARSQTPPRTTDGNISQGTQGSDFSSPGQVTAAAGLLLALANGGHNQSPTKSPPRETDGSSSGSSVQSSPSTPLSSACLLVAAAVGHIEPGFKFPKTKKAIMNEWLNKSPDNMPIPNNQSDYYVPTKNLASLVQAASLCDSPPQPGAGNAKKRWLRQAIREESDSPNSRPESPPSSETVAAPPKKRRLARESLSSEQSFTPPATPTMLVPPATLGEDEDGNADDEYYDDKSNLDHSDPSDTSRVEIVYSQQDAESPQHTDLEPEAVLKERVAQMQIEFGVKRTDLIPPPDDNAVIGTPEIRASLLNPLNRFTDSSMMLGAVENTLRFYEQQLGAVETETDEPEVEKQPKPEVITPAKRKLSISEYRQRKRQPVDQPSVESNNNNSNESPVSTSPVARVRSDSASSTTSSVTSEEGNLANLDLPNNRGIAAFSPAPTMVERQRENACERLKKALGLNLDEDIRKNVAVIQPAVEQDASESDFYLDRIKASVPATFVPDSVTVPETSAPSLIDSSALYEGRNPSPPPSYPAELE